MKALFIENNLWASALKAVGPAGWLAVSGAGKQGCIPLRRSQNPHITPLSQAAGDMGTGWDCCTVSWQAVRSQPGSVQRANKAIYSLSFFIAFRSIFQKNKVTFLVYLCIRQINAAILLSPGMEGCAALQTLMVWQMSIIRTEKCYLDTKFFIYSFFSPSR